LAAIFLLAALALAAQTVYPPNKRASLAPKPPPAAAKTQKQAAQPDALLEAAIRAKFAKSKIDAEKFQVHVQGGVATIEGKTDVLQHKGVATRLAKSAGAVAVNNHVQSSDAAKQKAVANLATGRRRAQIKRGDARSDPRTNAKAPSALKTGK
jgi:pyruvate/2-oxoglutarate dehydrogenase complex dihydrolipoamide acyltransferase (E2) component